MASPSLPKPVLLLCAVISRYDEANAWARHALEHRFGPIALRSEPFDHRETTYYTSTMGPDLKKWFLAFSRSADSAGLPDWKLSTNALEADYAVLARHPEPRPLNLDPGYLTEAKLVLATTKDRDHRIYLRDGIYAEVTLRYQAGEWKSQPWTYPDYQRADYHAFFMRCREFLRSAERGTASPK